VSAKEYSLDDLLQVMARLRDPEYGCPWDLEQTFKTIVPSTLEECYELAYAIETENYDHVAEELGDVLFQVVFYAQLGEEQQLFDFPEVVNTLVEKLLRRHPHVFPNGDLLNRVELEGTPPISSEKSLEDVRVSWENIKQQERNARALNGIFDDVARALPSLTRAQKIQKRAAGINFDWPDYRGAVAKVREELSELRNAIQAGDEHSIEEEMGDLLFSCVNVSRHLGVDAETSLRNATQKFESRIESVVTLAASKGLQMNDMSSSELEVLWLEAKQTKG
jgi:ATP diphosphatase